MIKLLFVFTMSVLVCSQAGAQNIPLWMDEVTGYEQPEWFNNHRVHIHTRNAHYWKPDTELYSQYGEMVSPLGVEVFTRHVKTREDPVFWITEVGAWDALANTRNVVQEAIDNAHDNGCKMIAYYTHYTDIYFKEKYPDWQCLDVDGKTIYHTGRGTHLCFNTPYADSVLVRLLEVAEMGADGIYFDGKHMPSDGCWCPACKAKFKELTGFDAPEAIDGSQLYKDYQTFNNNSIREAFLKWRRGLLAEYPDLVMAVSSNILPRFSARHLNTELIRLSGSHKTEWDLAVRQIKKNIMPEGISVPDLEVFMGMNYTFIRDIGDGRPAHVWVPGMSFVPPDHIKAAAAGQIAFGNIANLDMKETHTPDSDFVEAIELGKILSPSMGNSTPLRWLLIHFNEKSQEKYLPDQSMAWMNNIYPMYGAYYVAQEKKVPVGFITDSQILQGLFGEAKVIFLPDTANMDPDLKSRIIEFRAEGGVVISQGTELIWHAGKTAFEYCRAGLSDQFDSVSSLPLMQSDGSSSFYHAQYYRKILPDTMVYMAAYTNKLAWVVSVSDETDALDLVNQAIPPESIDNISLTVRRDEEPLLVRDVVTGDLLPWMKEDGQLKVTIPGFRFNALVEIHYDNTITGKSENIMDIDAVPSLYYSPENDLVILRNIRDNASYEIYNLSGQKVAQGKITGESVNVQDIGTGIFLFRIDHGSEPVEEIMFKM